MMLTVDQALRKAATFAKKGQIVEAKNLYAVILQRFPANQRAVEGLQALLPGPQGAMSAQERATLIALYNQNKCEEVITRAAALQRRYAATPMLHIIEGAAHAQIGCFEWALRCYDRALEIRPDHAEAHNNRGIALKELGRLDDALASYDQALRFAPKLANAHNNRGNALRDLGQLEAALTNYDSAILLAPDSADAHNNRGLVLRVLKRWDEALASCDAALRLRPDFVDAHNNRGIILRNMCQPEQAIASFEKALRLRPNAADAHNNLGNVLRVLKRPGEALIHYEAALRLQPDSADVHNNRGSAFSELERWNEALTNYDLAIRLRPDWADIYANRAIVMQKLERFDEAIADFEQALQLKPDFDEALGQLLHQKAHMCDWSEPAQGIDMATLNLARGGIPPFAGLALDDNPDRQLARAKYWIDGQVPVTRPALPKPPARPEKLKIGYFAADFHGHPSMHLIARLFEVHDRSRFEWHAFSFGPDKQDAMRDRVAAAFDRFHDVRALSDSAVVELARDLAIDIAIDLGGHTRDNRASIFAHRAAPVQINYLGYPGTVGADFIDYIIADKVLVPPPAQKFYSEKVIYLPHCYQPNDNQRVISEKTFTRAEQGLPNDGFVFCCFNNNYKISPAEFDIWMRLLRQVEGSVLWLLEGNRWIKANLAKEAKARGIDPSRLVFAGRVPPSEHLARHRCADLFLDTFNYNAHTTASDALWTGLPIVTKAGESFAARVAASLLDCIGMPELVTHTARDYEQLALELASDPMRLAAVKAKLAANRLTTPLFDSENFARDIEHAYDLAYDRRAAGLPADHFRVDPHSSDGPQD